MYEEPRITKDERAKIVKNIKKKNTSVASQMTVQRISLSSRGVVNLISDSVDNQTIKEVGTLKALKAIRFSDTTNITSLENLPDEPNLKEIIASNTKLTSYKGLSKYNKVTTIKVDGTPMTNRNNYRIALLIAFGPRLQTINGINITKEERQKAAKYPAICKKLVDCDWDPTNEPPSRKELLQIMDQYHLNECHQKTAINKEKLKVQLSPKKSLSAVPPKKQDYVYNKYERDEQLMADIAERLASVGIYIPQTDEMEISILEALGELVNIATSIADTCEFREYSDSEYDVSGGDSEINFDNKEQIENEKASASSHYTDNENSEAELSQDDNEKENELEKRPNQITEIEEISEIQRIDTDKSKDEKIEVQKEDNPKQDEDEKQEDNSSIKEEVAEISEVKTPEEKVPTSEISPSNDVLHKEEEEELESIEKQVEKIEKLINERKLSQSSSEDEEEEEEEDDDEEEESNEKEKEPAQDKVENHTEEKKATEEEENEDEEEEEEEDDEEEEEDKNSGTTDVKNPNDTANTNNVQNSSDDDESEDDEDEEEEEEEEEEESED